MAGALKLQWRKCWKDVWCPLNTADLTHEAFGVSGVYVVWHEGTTARTVTVGQGPIRDRILSCREDPAIQAFASLGLHFTWAEVAPQNRAGVVAYLTEMMKPRIAVKASPARPISVNFPR